MDNSKQLSHQAADIDTTPIKFWGTIVLAALGILTNTFLLRSALQLPEAPISYAAKTLHVLVILIAFLVILLTIRGYQKLGTQVVFYLVIVLFAAGSFIYAENALTELFSFTMISVIVISQLLPKSSSRRSIFVTVGVWMIIGLAAWMDPSWRLQPRTVVGVGLAASILFAAILVALVIRLSWIKIISSIRLQITVLAGLLVAFLTIVLVAYSVITTRQATIASAETEALAIAKTQAEDVKSQVEPALESARTLAYSLGVVKNPGHPTSLTRDQANAMLKKVAEKNPTFLGTWTIWEPNAFDGLDAQFANTPLHDNSGRFIPYWVRVDETIHGEAIKDYEVPGLGDFYTIPRQTKKEMLTPPFYYDIDGKKVLMTSLVVPIMENNRFYGVVGVDLKIDFVQGIVDKIDLYSGTATAVLVTDSGTLVAVRNQPNQVLQSATSLYPDFEQIQPRIAAGESFISLSADGQYLRVFSPVNVGETGSHSSLGLIIPFTAITASATASAIQQVFISLGIIILSLLALWYLTGQIIRPIIDLTTVANAISTGNLNAVADVQTPNETGVLAKAFNTMTSRLQEILQGLEQRVADRTRNLELAAEVGRTVSQVKDLDVMLKDAAEIIRSRFDLYYVQVYLANHSHTTLILKAGTGSAGEQLLARGHQLPLNGNSINGRAAMEKRSVVISDTAASVTFHPNPILPNTQSEMAVPLIIGEKVVGVLDMQSAKPGALSQENLVAFEALAAQLAVAIQNANLLAETVQARSELEAQARRVSQANWADYLDAIHKPDEIGYVFQQDKVMPLTEDVEPKEDALIAPINILGETLGNLVVELDGQSSMADPRELLEIVARQISLQVEELRLLDRAERYRMEAEATARRTTIVGWRDYIESRPENTVSYLYDSKEVKALHEELEKPALTIPILIGDEKIGKFSLQEMGTQDDQSLDIAQVVVERLGTHIENLRLYDQSKSAQFQSEKLFEASSQLTQAANLQELVATTVASLNIPAVNRALLTSFQYGPSGDIEQLTIIGNWWNGSGHNPTPIGTIYPREVMRVMSMFISPIPVFFSDTLDDERIDPSTMEIVQRLNLRSVAILPLHSSNKQIGALALEGEEPHKFTPQETRLFISLAPQIATILENRQQYEQAQRQAEREAMLNVINQKIQGATSVEAVLQIAARELGHALGAPLTIAQLGLKSNGNGKNSN